MSDPSAPATKEDLDHLKEELQELKEELKVLATKEELKEMEDRIVLTLAGEIARGANVMVEHMTSLLRVADDRTSAVGDRVAVVEQRVEDHVADVSVHRAPRRRAR